MHQFIISIETLSEVNPDFKDNGIQRMLDLAHRFGNNILNIRSIYAEETI